MKYCNGIKICSIILILMPLLTHGQIIDKLEVERIEKNGLKTKYDSASSLYSQNIFGQADMQFTEILKVEKINSDLRYFSLVKRGYSRYALDRHKEAMSDLKEATNMNVKFITTLHYYGSYRDIKKESDIMCFYILGDITSIENPNEALNYYSKGAQLGDSSCATLMHLTSAEIKLISKNFEQAIKSYSDLINYDIGKSDAIFIALTNRGVLKAALGDYHGAIKDLNDALIFIPNGYIKFSKQGYLKYRDEKLGLIFKNLGRSYVLVNEAKEGCHYLRLAGEKGQNVYDYIRQYCN